MVARRLPIFYFSVVEQVLVDRHSTVLGALVIGVQFAGQIPKMLASVKQVDNQRRAREVLIG
jgi:hypothetical protein